MIHTLDTYQIDALNAIKKNKATVLLGNKSSGKSYLLKYLLKDRWIKGKSTLVVLPDSEKAKLFQRHLGEFSLSKYSYILDESATVSQSNIARIKALAKEEKIEVSKKLISFNSLHKEETLNKIKKYFSIQNEKVLFNKSLSELVQINAFDVNSFKNIHFNQIFDTSDLEFNENEFSIIHNNIKLASELQKKGENKTDIYYTKKAYIEKNTDVNWKKISNWIKESKISVLKVIQDISGFLHSQSVDQFNQRWTIISSIFNKIEGTILEIDNFNIQFEDFDPNQSNLFGLDKQHNELKEKFQLGRQKIQLDFKSIILELEKFPSIKDNYQLHSANEEDISIIHDYLKKLTTDIVLFEEYIKQKISKELKSMNFRNLKNETLDKIQEDLKNIFGNLNNGFTNIKWEDNAFSLNKQLNYLEAILEDLNRLSEQKPAFFNNFSWNNLLNNADKKSVYFIRKFNIYSPKNWVLFFKNYYIQNLILKNKHHINRDINKDINSLLKINEKQEVLRTSTSKRIWQNKRKIVINKYKNDSNNSIKDIFNHVNPSITTKELLDINNDFLEEFFPVVIATSSIIPMINDFAKSHFDMIIYDQNEKYKDTFDELIPPNFDGQLVISLEDSDKLNIVKKSILKKNHNTEVSTFELKGYHQQGMISLLDMNYTERLYAARNLAHLMQSANQDIKIFQMKNTVIFSALDEIINKVLLKVLSKTGIKEMRIIDTPFHLLVDNLLDVNGKQILLTQNNMLNYKSIDNIIWQKKAISKISKGGIKVVNFNTSDLLTNPIESFKAFIQKNIL